MKKRLIISATETTVSEYLVSVAPERGGGERRGLYFCLAIIIIVTFYFNRVFSYATISEFVALSFISIILLLQFCCVIKGHEKKIHNTTQHNKRDQTILKPILNTSLIGLTIALLVLTHFTVITHLA